jgi:hypothetical protein
MDMWSDCAASCGAAAAICEETGTEASVESVAARAGAAGPGGNGTRPLGGMWNNEGATGDGAGCRGNDCLGVTASNM